MFQTQQPRLPTWGKVLIGIVFGFAILAVVAVAIGALSVTRITRGVTSESSGKVDTTFSSTLRWQEGVLVADVAVNPTNKESAQIVKITSVTVNDTVSDHFVSNLQKPGTLSFPLTRYRGAGGDQGQIRIKYEIPSTGESGGESSLINVPAKPINRVKN